MKKSLVALAALAVAGVASAQSSVTLFGVVDAAISGYSNKADDVTPYTLGNYLTPGFAPVGSIKTTQTALTNSGYNSSRLGFRGTEDLGGGLAASFWLEAGNLSNDDGVSALGNFQRRSTVSLSGGFGEIRLGRDYKPTFWNHTVFDPFGTNGVGTNLIQTAGGGLETGGNVRASNSVGYFLPPNLGGFYGQLQYAFHERTSIDSGVYTPAAGTLADSRSGRYAGGRFGYANGPLDVAVAYGQSTNTSNFQLGRDEYAKNFNLGASYDFGVVKLFGEYSQVKNSIEFDPQGFGRTDSDTRTKGYLLGLDRSGRRWLDPCCLLASQARQQRDRPAVCPGNSRSEGPQARAWLRAQPVEAHRAVRHGCSREQQRRCQLHLGRPRFRDFVHQPGDRHHVDPQRQVVDGLRHRYPSRFLI